MGPSNKELKTLLRSHFALNCPPPLTKEEARIQLDKIMDRIKKEVLQEGKGA